MNTLKRLWDAWRAFGKWMADAVGRVVMFVLYVTVVAPFGLSVRLFSDPLQLRSADPHWQSRANEPPNVKASARTF